MKVGDRVTLAKYHPVFHDEIGTIGHIVNGRCKVLFDKWYTSFDFTESELVLVRDDDQKTCLRSKLKTGDVFRTEEKDTVFMHVGVLDGKFLSIIVRGTIPSRNDSIIVDEDDSNVVCLGRANVDLLPVIR